MEATIQYIKYNKNRIFEKKRKWKVSSNKKYRKIFF